MKSRIQYKKFGLAATDKIDFSEYYSCLQGFFTSRIQHFTSQRWETGLRSC
jgi:hypothetical protein